MPHNGIFATSSEILTKAGANYSTGVTETKINELCLQVENQINCSARYNFSDEYATLSADVKYLLSEIASDLAAMYIISYDMSGYTSRFEAQTMLDVLRDRAEKGLTLLNDMKVRDFMLGV